MKKFISLFFASFMLLAGTALSDTFLPVAVWTDMTTALGIEAGEATTLQNIGRTTVRISTSLLEPLTASEGIVAPPDSVTTFDVRPVGPKRIWVFNTSSNLLGQIASLPDMSVTPSVAMGAPLDFEVEIAAGRIPGKSRILKFGSRDNLPGTSGNFAVVWNGPTDDYVPPTQARIHDITSTAVADTGVFITGGTITTNLPGKVIDSNALFINNDVFVGDAVINDSNTTIGVVTSIDSETQLTVEGMRDPMTGLFIGVNNVGDKYRVIAATGVGAAIVWVLGLDADLLEQQEFVVLQGTAGEITFNAYLRQSRMKTFLVGGMGTSAVGVITSTAEIDLTVTAQIDVDANQTLMAVQTIPMNKRGYLKTWRGALTRKQAATSTIRLRVGALDGVSYISKEEGLVTTGKSSFEHSMGGFVLAPGTDVWVEADADSVNVGVSASLDIILEDL